MTKEKEFKNQKYNKSDVIKNVDENGRLLTYQVVDFFRPELQPSGIVKEFNTLKELNLWLKKQEVIQVPNKIAEMQEDFKMENKTKVKFAQGGSGQVYIRQGESEIEFNLNELDEEGIRELTNGLGNILTSLSASLYERIKNVNGGAE